MNYTNIFKLLNKKLNCLSYVDVVGYTRVGLQQVLHKQYLIIININHLDKGIVIGHTSVVKI